MYHAVEISNEVNHADQLASLLEWTWTWIYTWTYNTVNSWHADAFLPPHSAVSFFWSWFLSISVYQSQLNHAANNPTYTAEEIPLGHPSAITFTLFLTPITTTSHKPTSLTWLCSSVSPPVNPRLLSHFTTDPWQAYRPRRRHPPLPHASAHPGHPLQCRS